MRDENEKCRGLSESDGGQSGEERRPAAGECDHVPEDDQGDWCDPPCEGARQGDADR